MIGTLTRRIHMICGDELSQLRRQMYGLTWQDIHDGDLECAATAMARKPSCVNHGVSVDVVCSALRAMSEDVTFMISVAMHLHPTNHRWQLPPDQHLVWKPPGATSHGMPAARRRSLHQYRR